MRNSVIGIVVACLSIGAWAACSFADDAAPAAGLHDSDFVAVVGDSITEQKLYSVYIEDYLLMCQPAHTIRTVNIGWSGERADGFLNRMDYDCIPFHPTVVTTCYGMNDGGYRATDPRQLKTFHDNEKAIVDKLKAANVRLIVVGSPGAVDTTTYKPNLPQDAAMYNKTLAAESDVAKQVAQEEGVVFADVHDPMIDVMAKAKAKYGPAYALAGTRDGVHPEPNGHLVMAYAFLKAMGCTGDVGTITAHLDTNAAEATDGHKVLSMKDGVIELESTRYPFCFAGADPAKPTSTRGVLEFLPFNDDLNRFRLIVTGTTAAKLKVTWGTESKEFTSDQLAKGINLAAEFMDNPFSEPFRQVEAKVQQQQNYDIIVDKTSLGMLHDLGVELPDQKEALAKMTDEFLTMDKQKADAAAAAVTPVKHTIKIEAEK